MRFVKILSASEAYSMEFQDVRSIMRSWKCTEKQVIERMKKLGLQSYRILGSPYLGLPGKVVQANQDRMRQWSKWENDPLYY